MHLRKESKYAHTIFSLSQLLLRRIQDIFRLSKHTKTELIKHKPKIMSNPKQIQPRKITQKLNKNK